MHHNLPENLLEGGWLHVASADLRMGIPDKAIPRAQRTLPILPSGDLPAACSLPLSFQAHDQTTSQTEHILI